MGQCKSPACGKHTPPKANQCQFCELSVCAACEIASERMGIAMAHEHCIRLAERMGVVFFRSAQYGDVPTWSTSDSDSE